jgi:hypothetical protein
MPTVKELRERAKAHKLRGYSKILKANLMKRVEDANRAAGVPGRQRIAGTSPLRALNDSADRRAKQARLILNPKTGRYVQRNGKVGRAIGGVQTRGVRAAIPAARRDSLRTLPPTTRPRTATAPANASMRSATPDRFSSANRRLLNGMGSEPKSGLKRAFSALPPSAKSPQARGDSAPTPGGNRAPAGRPSWANDASAKRKQSVAKAKKIIADLPNRPPSGLKRAFSALPPTPRASATPKGASAGPRASAVSPDRVRKVCGVFEHALTKAKLAPMSMHTQAFKDQLLQKLKPLIQPQLDIFAEYAKRQELACAEPRLKNTCAPHQLVVQELARLLANNDPSALGGHRGLMVWHSTGSGKTTAVCALFVAFYNTGHRVMLTTTLENKRNNSPSVFAKTFLEFFPGFVAKAMGKSLAPTAANVKNVADALFDNNSGADKPFIITTLEEFDNALKGGFAKYGPIHERVKREQRPGGKYAKGTCVIVDEAQNLFDSGYKRVLDALMDQRTVAGRGASVPFNDTPTKVFAVTATPGSSVPEYLKMLSLVRRTDQGPFASAEPMYQFDGLVSYIDYKHPARFAKVVGPHNVGVPLPPAYFAALLQKYETDKDATSAAEPGVFMRSTKQGGNFLAKTSAGALYDAIKASPGVVEVGVSQGRKVLASPKMVEIARRVSTSPGKQYVYFQTKASSDAFCGLLKTLGFSPANPKSASNVSALAPGKRFVQYAKASADAPSVLVHYKALMRAQNNLHGEVCKVIVTHGKDYEGLDISALRGVHIGDPLFSTGADMQAIGRGARHCGHAGLSGDALKIDVNRYFATPPTRELNAANVGGKGKRGETKLAKVREALSKFAQTRGAVVRDLARTGELPANAGGFDFYAHAKAQFGPAQRAQTKFEDELKRHAVDAALLRDFRVGGAKSPPRVSSRKSSPTPPPAPMSVNAGSTRMRLEASAIRRQGAMNRVSKTKRKLESGAELPTPKRQRPVAPSASTRTSAATKKRKLSPSAKSGPTAKRQRPTVSAKKLLNIASRVPLPK